jgi:DNA polymerase III alpha subunit
MPESAFAAADALLATPVQWERRVRAVCAAAGVPQAAEEALAHNRLAAERCRLELDLGVPIFPHAPRPPGATGAAHLQSLCEQGMRERYGRHRRTRPACAFKRSSPSSSGWSSPTISCS